MKRRDFLAALVAVPAVWLLACRRDEATRGGELAPLFAGLPDAVAIGALYLERFPDEIELRRFGALVLAEITSEDAEEGLRWSDLAARVERDFAQGRTIELDGWILSESEARLCALVALEPPVH